MARYVYGYDEFGNPLYSGDFSRKPGQNPNETVAAGRVLWGRSGRGIPPPRLGPDLSGFRHWAALDEAILDDGGGSYTGAANDDIVYPTSISRYLRQKFGGAVNADFTTGASVFGSYTQAKTDLDALVSGDWEVILRNQEVQKASDAEARLMQQAPIAFWRSQWTSKFMAQVYKSTPASGDYFKDPAGNTYSWSLKTDVLKGSVSIQPWVPEDAVHEVHIRFALYAPNDTFQRECFVGPGDSDDGTGTRDQNAASPNDREARIALSISNLGKKNPPLILECDQIYRPEMAAALRNFLIDKKLPSRISLSFDTTSKVTGLEPHMVTKLSNDWQDLRPVPKYPSGSTAKNWNDLDFFVADKVRGRLTDQGMVWTVRLEEVT